MRINQDRIVKTLLIFCAILLSAPVICRAEVSITVSGVGAVESANLTKAEQLALQDAFSQAVLKVALNHVQGSSVPDLIRLLPEYLSSRGMQDIVQYQVVSRSQMNGALQLSVDIKLNDDPLKEWINTHALSVPQGLRPKIVLMISSLDPGRKKASEWWTDRNRSGYSTFENQFAGELRSLGENVIGISQTTRTAQPENQKPQDIARSLGADLLISGSLTYTPLFNKINESTLKLTLIDVKTQTTISSWSVSHKSDLAIPAMNLFMIDELMKPLRSRIGMKIVRQAPLTIQKELCIEGITEHGTYQLMIKALKATAGVSQINITSINGASHSICHRIELNGSMTDTLENLKRQQIAESDMIVEDDKAYIRIIK